LGLLCQPVLPADVDAEVAVAAAVVAAAVAAAAAAVVVAVAVDDVEIDAVGAEGRLHPALVNPVMLILQLSFFLQSSFGTYCAGHNQLA